MRFYSSPYQGYVSPDVFKKPVNTGAIGIGVASFFGAGALGLIAAAIGGEPHARHVIPTVGIPALGAGFLAYLLRWNLDRKCPPCPPEAAVFQVPELPKERPSGPGIKITKECPEGFYWDDRAGRCMDIPI